LFFAGTDQDLGFVLTIDNESKGLDIRGDSEKIVSNGGWGAAGMMRYFYHRDKGISFVAFKNAPTPNAKPNSESPFMSSPFDTLLMCKVE
jgi:hypothetical protein